MRKDYRSAVVTYSGILWTGTASNELVKRGGNNKVPHSNQRHHAVDYKPVNFSGTGAFQDLREEREGDKHIQSPYTLWNRIQVLCKARTIVPHAHAYYQ